MLKAAEAADRAADARTPQEEMRAVIEVFKYKEAMQIALMNQKVRRVAESHRAQERLPLIDEGHPYGRVEARIPKDLFFHLMRQRNFGWDGFCDNGGMKDFLKAFPQCRVKTISGKTAVGWTRGGQSRQRKPCARFAPGVLNLAT